MSYKPCHTCKYTIYIPNIEAPQFMVHKRSHAKVYVHFILLSMIIVIKQCRILNFELEAFVKNERSV